MKELLFYILLSLSVLSELVWVEIRLCDHDKSMCAGFVKWVKESKR